jgi:hypothetical protein
LFRGIPGCFTSGAIDVIKTEFVYIIYNLYRIIIIIIIIIMDVVYLSLHLTAKRTETTSGRRKWKVSMKNTSDVEHNIRNRSKTKRCPSVRIETQIQDSRNSVY